MKDKKKKKLATAEMNAASSKNPDDYEIFNEQENRQKGGNKNDRRK